MPAPSSQPTSGACDRIFRDAPILVLGATGFIGGWMVRELRRRGARLHLAVRDLDAARRLLSIDTPDRFFHEVDLERKGSAAEMIRRLRPRVVFNLAGYGVDRAERDPSRAQRMNTGLPEELALAVADLGSWAKLAPDMPALIHVGSALEYGEIGGDLAEDSTPAPATLYGRTKLEGTLAVKRVCSVRASRGLTARLFSVFGPGEHPGRLLPTLIRSIETTGRIALTTGTQQRDFCYVEDVAESLANLACAEALPGEIVNVASGRLTSVRQFVEATASLASIDPARLDFGSVPLREEEMCHEPVRVQRLRELIGRVPSFDLHQGIARSLERARRDDASCARERSESLTRTDETMEPR